MAFTSAAAVTVGHLPSGVFVERAHHEAGGRQIASEGLGVCSGQGGFLGAGCWRRWGLSSHSPSKVDMIPSPTCSSRPLQLGLGRGRRSRSSQIRADATDGTDSSGLRSELKEGIESYITSNKIVLFMKGNKLFPQCGFSNTCVQILNVMNVPFETVNILESEELRQGMKEYSNWPTFPQLYVDKEFVGGCDIMIELYQNGELKEMLEKALVS